MNPVAGSAHAVFTILMFFSVNGCILSVSGTVCATLASNDQRLLVMFGAQI